MTRTEAIIFEELLGTLKGVRDALQRMPARTCNERTVQKRAILRAEGAIGKAEALRDGAFGMGAREGHVPPAERADA